MNCVCLIVVKCSVCSVVSKLGSHGQLVLQRSGETVL